MTAIFYAVILYSGFGAGQLVLREHAAIETQRPYPTVQRPAMNHQAIGAASGVSGRVWR